MIDRSVALFRQGRLAEAEQMLAQFLQQQPDHFDALHLFGLIARQSGRSALAVELITRAIRQNPGFPAAHRHLGNALMDLRRPEQAVESYDTAIALRADFAEAYVSRGFALLELRRPAAALENFERAIALRWRVPLVYHGRAAALLALQRSAEALACCDEALTRTPDLLELHIDRAAALRALLRPAEALQSCERALQLSPDAAQALLIQGAAQADLNQPEAAVASFERAIAQLPGEARAHNGLGAVLLDLQRPAEALVCFDQAIALQPEFAEAHNNRGIALGQLMQFEAALACIEKAMALQQGEGGPYYLNAAHAHLQLGRFESGWPLYEWRARQGAAAAAAAWPQPCWLGREQIAGKTLLILAEQGLGDTIQFCRYARSAEQLGARVVLSAPARLLRLLRGLSASIQYVDEQKPPPAFDCYCRLLSLPLALRTTLGTIPAPAGYLQPEPERIAYWRSRIGPQGFRIGIAWQGGISRMDLGRSFPLLHLHPLAALPGIRLISLQKGAGTEQLHALPQDMPVQQLAEPFDDGPDAFIETAALMHCMDLIITSDTSIAHLAGALGRPTWVALKQVPDWRWLLGREDCPWYPSVRLFRQQRAGDWDGVVAAMRAAFQSGEAARLEMATSAAGRSGATDSR
jgi:tetratricopeptide (TPR) repeat protein